jgi:hypothetical protein
MALQLYAKVAPNTKKTDPDVLKQCLTRDRLLRQRDIDNVESVDCALADFDIKVASLARK